MSNGVGDPAGHAMHCVDAFQDNAYISVDGILDGLSEQQLRLFEGESDVQPSQQSSDDFCLNFSHTYRAEDYCDEDDPLLNCSNGSTEWTHFAPSSSNVEVPQHPDINVSRGDVHWPDLNYCEDELLKTFTRYKKKKLDDSDIKSSPKNPKKPRKSTEKNKKPRATPKKTAKQKIQKELNVSVRDLSVREVSVREVSVREASGREVSVREISGREFTGREVSVSVSEVSVPEDPARNHCSDQQKHTELLPPRFNEVGTDFKATKLYPWNDNGRKGVTITPLPAAAAGSERPVLLKWSSIRKAKKHTIVRRPLEPCLVCADDSYPGNLSQMHIFHGCSLTPCRDHDDAEKIPAGVDQTVSFPIYGHCCSNCYNDYKRDKGVFYIRDRVVVMSFMAHRVKKELMQTARDLHMLPANISNKLFIHRHHKPYFELTAEQEVKYTGDVPLKISAPILSWGGIGALNVTSSYLAVYPTTKAHLGPCNIVVYPAGTDIDISFNIKEYSNKEANCKRSTYGIVYTTKRIAKGDVLRLERDMRRLWERFFPHVPFPTDETSPVYLSGLEKLRVIAPDDPAALSPTEFETFLSYNLEPRVWSTMKPWLPDPKSYGTLRDFVESASMFCDDVQQAAMLKFLPPGFVH
jgi:hypothetical protein